MPNSATQAVLKKIQMNYLSLTVLTSEDINDAVKDEELRTFLFTTGEGLKIRESLSAYIFDIYMMTVKMEKDIDSKRVSIDFLSSGEALRTKKLLDSGGLRAYLNDKRSIFLKVTHVGRMLLIEFKK